MPALGFILGNLDSIPLRCLASAGDSAGAPRQRRGSRHTGTRRRRTRASHGAGGCSTLGEFLAGDSDQQPAGSQHVRLTPGLPVHRGDLADYIGIGVHVRGAVHLLPRPQHGVATGRGCGVDLPSLGRVVEWESPEHDTNRHGRQLAHWQRSGRGCGSGLTILPTATPPPTARTAVAALLRRQEMLSAHI